MIPDQFRYYEVVFKYPTSSPKVLHIFSTIFQNCINAIPLVLAVGYNMMLYLHQSCNIMIPVHLRMLSGKYDEDARIVSNFIKKINLLRSQSQIKRLGSMNQGCLFQIHTLLERFVRMLSSSQELAWLSDDICHVEVIVGYLIFIFCCCRKKTKLPYRTKLM